MGDASPSAALRLAAHASLREALGADLNTLSEAGLLRSLRQFGARRGAELEYAGRTVVDFSSNDYLGLASHEALADAAQGALAGQSLGAAAARLVSGNHELHMRLEQALARFKRTDAALLFASGYLANVGAIPALVGRRDVIYADELNHASLIDACRLARAELRVIAHCDVDAMRNAIAADAGRFRRRVVVVDSVFSMDGDMYPLDFLVELAREHGVWTYVDDAHGTGVLGENGRGAAEHWGVEGEIDVMMGTLGKALGVSGAFIAGSRTLVDYLMNRARSFVYTTGSPPILAAAALRALSLLNEEGWRRDRLRANARRIRAGLCALGREPQGVQDAHIIPVVLRGSEVTMRVGAKLLEHGFLVGAIRPPTVPVGGARLRITASAAHSDAQIDSLLHALANILGAELPHDGAGSAAGGVP